MNTVALAAGTKLPDATAREGTCYHCGEALGQSPVSQRVEQAMQVADIRRQHEAAAEAQTEADARLHELTEALPALDDARRAQQDALNRDTAQQSALRARLDALRALQEKVQAQDKVKPWLARHGLDGLQGLWTRLHIEPGWETALEAALRERLAALEVGRLDTVRAFAADAPPARLAFYTPPAAAIASTHRTLPRLADLLLSLIHI